MRHLLRISCCVAALFSSVALAQTAGPPASDDGVIVVQGEARGRLTAPLSAQTLTRDDLVRLGATTLDSVAIAVPGLSMINDQDPGTNIVSMRGVTTDRLQQAALAYVMDGVALADTELFTGPLFDVERIDVLRGPQGALYGKSAAGGAIEVRSVSGREDAGGYLSAALGDGGMREAQGAATLSLNQDWRMRAAARWYAVDGWIENRTLGRVVDAEESRALRLRLEGSAFGGAIDATLFLMEEDGGAAWASSGDVTGDFGGNLSGAALTDPIGDYEGRSYRKWAQGAVRYTATIANDVDLTLLLARDSYRKRWDEELDYRPGPLTFFGAPLFPNGLQPIRQPTDIDATTFEARIRHSLSSDDAKISLTYGVFAQDIDRNRIDDFGPLLFGANPAAYEGDTLQSAAFVGVSRTDAHSSLDFNLRLDRDQRRQIIRDAVTGVRLDARKASFTRVQPRLAGSVKAADDLWLFAAYGEGFRSGGFNPTPTAGAIWRSQFEPEITRSLEAGVKFGRDALRIEATLFAAAIDEYQNYTFLDGNSVTINVDRVDVRGGEALTQLNDIAMFDGAARIALAIAYADAKIARYIAPDPLIVGAQRNYSGKRVPNAPLWSGAASWDWERSLNADATVSLGAVVNATGATVFELDNVLRAPSKTWLDLRAGVRSRDWRLQLTARNVTDERWAISAFGQGMLPLLAGLGPDGPFDTFTLNRGRQIFVELRREF